LFSLWSVEPRDKLRRPRHPSDRGSFISLFGVVLVHSQRPSLSPFGRNAKSTLVRTGTVSACWTTRRASSAEKVSWPRRIVALRWAVILRVGLCSSHCKKIVSHLTL